MGVTVFAGLLVEETSYLIFLRVLSTSQKERGYCRQHFSGFKRELRRFFSPYPDITLSSNSSNSPAETRVAQFAERLANNVK